MEDTEKVQLSNACFDSVFSAKEGAQASQSIQVREDACRKDDLPLVEKDQ